MQTDSPSAQLAQLAISASGFVFDPHTGATFSVNATGRALLEGLRDGLPMGALVERLRGGFETRGADLERDVLEYVRSLQDVGILPLSFDLE